MSFLIQRFILQKCIGKNRCVRTFDLSTSSTVERVKTKLYNIYLRGCGSSADVEKVCWRSAVKLDDVHGGHGQSGAVDHAADVAVERDVVEVVSGGLDLALVLLGPVSLIEYFLLSEIGVVVEAKFSVQAEVYKRKSSYSGVS